MIDHVGVHQTHCCFYCKNCKYGDEDCPVLNKSVAQARLCWTCFEHQADPKLVAIVSELERLAKACESSEEWAKGRTDLDFCESGMYLTHVDGELKNQYHEACVLYDDGDHCAEVHDNLGLGLNGDAFAELFAKCSPKNILELCSLIRSAI